MNNLFVNLMGAGCDNPFNWYGFIIGVGMVICIALAYFMGVKRGYYKDMVFDMAIICIPLAIVGARLYYVIFDIIGGGAHWTFAEIIGLGERGLSGLAIYGGLIGASIGGFIVHFWKRKKPTAERATFLQMADLAFTVIILGQAIGRWGNFANQEAFGNPVTNEAWQWFPYAVHITKAGVTEGWYQATFFYESFLNLIGFALLMWIYNGKRKSFDGFSLSVYCIYYGVVRFFIEGLRSDSLWLIEGTIRVSQALSIVIIIFGIVFILAHLYRARANGKKAFIMVDKAKLDSSYFGYDTCILAHPNVYEKKKEGGNFFTRLFAKTDEERAAEEAEEKFLHAKNAKDDNSDLGDNSDLIEDGVISGEDGELENGEPENAEIENAELENGEIENGEILVGSENGDVEKEDMDKIESGEGDGNERKE